MCLRGYRHLKPTVGCQISTLIFEKNFMEGGLYKYPMNNILRTAKFFPIGVSIKGISRVFNWLKCLGGIMHLKPTAGFFVLWRGGGLYKYLMKNISRKAKFLPIWGFNQRYARVFNLFKYLGGFPHLKLTAGCQISTLICSEVSCSGIFPTLQITTSFPEFPYWWVIREDIHKGSQYNLMQPNLGFK